MHQHDLVKTIKLSPSNTHIHVLQSLTYIKIQASVGWARACTPAVTNVLTVYDVNGYMKSPSSLYIQI